MTQVSGHRHNPDRDANDFYPTDRRWTELLLRNMKLPDHITEPCAGDGAISKVLVNNGHQVISSDISPRFDACVQLDAFDIAPCSCIVTNPPYGIAPKLIPSLILKSDLVCLLLRLNYLEGKTRIHTTRQLSKVVVVAGRMTVFGKVSQFPHAWFIWDKNDCTGKTELVVDVVS